MENEMLSGSIRMKKAEVNLNNISSLSLLSPFAMMNSVPRLDMVNNAFKHCVIPIDPETAIVDSAYTNDILLSTENIIERGGVKLLDKIHKVLNNYVCETTYIYEELSSGELKMISVPKYENCYKYGYGVTSAFDKMNIGDVKTDNVWVKQFDFYDMENGIVKIGKNINYIYTTSKLVGEDAIAISRELAESFRKPHMETIKFNISPEYILRNIYGDDDIYKPLPLPGDKLRDGLIISSYIDEGKSFLAYDDKRHLGTDYEIMTQLEDAEVVDLQIYSKDDIPIDSIEEIRIANRDYFRNIVNTTYKLMQQYPSDKVHYSIYKAQDKYNRLLSWDFRIGMDELKNDIYVEIKILQKRALEVGDKLTNRHGGKGVISTILDKPLYGEFGTPIHMIVNGNGVFPRENMGQIMESGLTAMWLRFQGHLKKSDIDNTTKVKNIVSFLEYANQPKQARVIEELGKLNPDSLVEYYKNNYIYLTYKPYHDPDEPEYMGIQPYVKLFEFVSSLDGVQGENIPGHPLYLIRPETIYFNDLPLSHRHYIHSALYLVLANGPTKANAIRGDDGVNSNGNPTKISKSKKTHRTKYSTNAAKDSDLVMNINVSSMFESDKGLLKNNTAPFYDSLNATGIDVVAVEEEILDD